MHICQNFRHRDRIGTWRTENLIFIIIYILYIENNIDMMYNAVTIKSEYKNIVTEVPMKINSEARFTTFEAVSMIVGNSIGTGIIAVPYLATKNSMLDVVWMVVIAYCINVILHLIIAELSYNNGGVQLVKSFEGELFHGKMKKVFSWIIFAVYGIAIMIGISGNINGGAQIFVNWFGIPFAAAQVIYYVIAGIVVFIGMKAVGIAQKYAVILLMGIVAVMTVATFMHPLNSFYTADFHWNNLLALYSMVVFATSANQAVIQVVKGLDGDAKKIRKSIFIGFALSSVFVLVVTMSVLMGTKGTLDKELAYMQLGESIGSWAMILAGIFSLFALLTTFWSNTLALRDVVHEQTGIGNRVSWLAATIPCILFAIFGVNSFIILTRIMSGVVVRVSIMLVLTYGKSRKKAGSSPICGVVGTVPFQVLMVVSTVISAIGALIPLS